jgi:hydroxylamine reductase (hybrid-cluster protein)
MALANINSEPLFDKTGSGKKRLSDTKIAKISASYAGNALNEEPSSPNATEALVYIVQEMQEDIQELRRYVTNEATGSAVKSISQVNVGDLPTRSIGLSSGEIYVLTEKDGTKTIKSA